MITNEDRHVVLKALKENLVSPDQILVCVWDIETYARGDSWDRTLPMRLVANGFLSQHDLFRLREAAAAEIRPAPRAAAAVATPPEGLTPVPTVPDKLSDLDLPPDPPGQEEPTSLARPSPTDHAAAAWLQQKRIVHPTIIQKAFRIQRDYAPFGITIPLPAILRRLGKLPDAPNDRLRRADLDSFVKNPSWKMQAVPGWAILGKIATGGCATVFRAREAFTGRTAALKILQRRLWNDPVSVERFEREGRLLTQLSHPDLVRGLAAGISPTGLPYTVMEYIPGEPVDRMLQTRGKFPLALALHVTRRVAEALAHIHKAGYVHRDVKPENILVDGNQKVTFCDLHLAKRCGTTPTPPRARTSGTAAYMSPEQARGETDLGAATDIYALGLTLYAMLTGRCPFEGDDPETVLARRFREGNGAPDLGGLAAPKPVVALLRRMLQPDRNRRCRDTEELFRAIAAIRA